MEIAIADRDRTPMWTIPGTNIFLSYEEPGPITLDTSLLTSDQKATILHAVKREVLVAKGLEEIRPAVQTQTPTPNVSVAKSYAVIEDDVYTHKAIAPDVPVVVDPVEEVKAKLEAHRKNIATIMGKPLFTVKKNLLTMSMADLYYAKSIEQSKGNRKSVISAIDDMINKLEKDVSDNIAKNTSDMEVKELPLSTQITDVEDSEETRVEVSLEDSDEE